MTLNEALCGKLVFYGLMSPDNGGMAHIQTVLTLPFATNATKNGSFSKVLSNFACCF